jgi:hypothetical protein
MGLDGIQLVQPHQKTAFAAAATPRRRLGVALQVCI